MAGPLIATKLYVPKPRRGLVARPRLLERMRLGADSRVVAGVRPGGVRQVDAPGRVARRRSRRRTARWRGSRSTPRTTTPATFWSYVVTALHGAIGGAGAGALELTRLRPVPTDLMLTTLLNELDAAPGDVWLVLDDYHLVDNPEVEPRT